MTASSNARSDLTVLQVSGGGLTGSMFTEIGQMTKLTLLYVFFSTRPDALS
jgi:hypothetical protein